MRVILFILGLLFSADGLFYAATTSMGVGEAIIVAAGIAMILWGVFYDEIKRNGFLRFLRGMFVFFMVVLVAYSSVICFIGRNDNATYREDYVVVLGAGLVGEEPTKVLSERLDKAVEYLNRNNNANVIVSGGKGKGESIPEALAMNNYLVSRGVAPERIAMEDKATSTYENFMYSKEFMEVPNAVFITNDFHVIRSVQMAELNGMDVTYVGASTPVTLLPVSCARELIAQIATLRYYVN